MGKNIIITAGPTNERIDAVMQITNMSTGSLGVAITETLLEKYGDSIDTIYYLSPKLARKPCPTTSKIVYVNVTDTDNLLKKLTGLLTGNGPTPGQHIDAVIHSAAVGDYKGRYAARAEDLADEIAKTVMNAPYGAGPVNKTSIRDAVLNILSSPRCVQNDETKISSYEPNLMVMLDLTPKVIGSIKQLSPDTMLIGFKLLENVSEDELFNVAARLRTKNRADYIVANDLAKIGGGNHPAMIIGPWEGHADRSTVVARCETKKEIAERLADLIMR